jgi:predicted kinase
MLCRMTTNPKLGPHAVRDAARSNAASPPHPEEKESVADRPLDRNVDDSAHLSRGPRIHLVIGPVGAGKSTYAIGLARERNALRLTLDAWMAILFRPDRPETGVMEWYRERVDRCIDQIWQVAKDVTLTGTAVVLEIGLIQRHQRASFYRRIDEEGLDLTIHVLDAPRELRRERVEARNRTRGDTFSMVVPPEVFDLASDLWEPPGAAECEGRDIHFIDAATVGPDVR